MLRHTLTSNLLSNGAAPKDVRELPGHAVTVPLWIIQRAGRFQPPAQVGRFRQIRRWLRVRRSFLDSFCRNIFSRFSNCRIFFFPSSISTVSSSRVFSLGFVMGVRSFLLAGIEKGQSIFSAAFFVLLYLSVCVV